MRVSRVVVAGFLVSAIVAGSAVMVGATGDRDSVGCKFSGVGVERVDQQKALARHRAITADWRERDIDKRLSRGCVIAISETYLQNLLVDEHEMDALLNEDVLRWTQQNKADPPRDTSAESIRASTRAGAERTVDDIINRRWIVEGNQALVIADIVVTGLAKPVTLYERFLIRWGQISEIEAVFLSPPA